MSDDTLTHVDMLVPTIGRVGLPNVINCILNQTHQNWRLNILADGYYQQVKDIVAQFTDNRIRVVEVPNGPLGNVGHHATRWAIENLDLYGWLYFTGDDDSPLPNCFESLIKATYGNVSMVIGVAQGMCKSDTNRFARWLGKQVQVCQVTGACGLYKIDDVKKLEAPCFIDSSYDSDWKLIERMMRYPYRQIDDVITIFPLTGL